MDKVYEGHLNKWKTFLKAEINQKNPFLSNVREEEEAALVALLMLRRHQEGHREKRAISFTAGAKMRFAQEIR